MEILDDNPDIAFWDIDENKVFHQEDPTNKRYYGIEWENDYYDGNEYLAEEFIDSLERSFPSRINSSYVYWHKTDGSIDNGYETVTAPMTYNALEEFLFRLEDKCVLSHTLPSEDGHKIGLHVHVNKDGFSGGLSAIRNAVYLVNNMHEFFAFTSGRDDFSYCRFRPTNKTEDREYYKYNHRQIRYERYLAVNTRPDKTIEFRYPGTRSSPLEILEQVELVKHVCDFADSRDRELFTWENIPQMRSEFAKYLIESADMKKEWLERLQPYVI